MSVSRDMKVGIFVVLGLFFAGLVIFLIGDERRLFSKSVEFKTTFLDVSGLKPGAPVRLGGIDIGQVSYVGYDKKNAEDPTVYVTFWVSDTEKGRIRRDTRAKIATKGLLGDKMVELTMGGKEEAAPPGTVLDGEAADDMMGRVGEMAGKAEIAIDNIAKATKPLGDEKLHRDIQGTVANMNHILNEVAHGQGYPTKLLSDPKEAERISKAVASLERTAHEAEGLLRDARRVFARVEQGPGFAHDIIYGDSPKGVTEVAAAANEIALTLKGVRESDSLVHDALYGGKGDGAEALKNVTAITADVRAIVSDMRAGKGTVGGLLVDPSVYEDLKVVLGNVQRNDVLRALVRYSIKQDEKKPDVTVAPPPKAVSADNK
ncbi:MAG: MCE family protein [Myxococcales bacterium]|nr:MCE family protein [Myxococcales bacterium]